MATLKLAAGACGQALRAAGSRSFAAAAAAAPERKVAVLGAAGGIGQPLRCGARARGGQLGLRGRKPGWGPVPAPAAPKGGPGGRPPRPDRRPRPGGRNLFLPPLLGRPPPAPRADGGGGDLLADATRPPPPPGRGAASQPADEDEPELLEPEPLRHRRDPRRGRGRRARQHPGPRESPRPGGGNIAPAGISPLTGSALPRAAPPDRSKASRGTTSSPRR